LDQQIEDALCLTTLLAQVGTTAETPTHEALEAAFATFDDVRRVRTQWLVNSSRRVCELYEQREWADPKRWVKAMTCFEEIKDRFEKIYSFDVDGMVERTKAEFQRRISSEKGQVSGRPSDEYKEF
jgi:salicylate hydroxylase